MQPDGYTLISNVISNSLNINFKEFITTGAVAISGRQPVNYQDYTDYTAPFRCDMTIIEGSWFDDYVIISPLGSDFQGMEEFTNEQQVKLSDITSNKIFVNKNCAIYKNNITNRSDLKKIQMCVST